VRGREEQLYTPGLVAVAVRAAAEVTSSAPSDEALRRAEQQVEWLTGFLDEHSPPIALAHLAGARAELARARGVPSPEAWAAVAAAWERLTHPYRLAYAKLREAEAIRETTRERSLVAEPLGTALAIARELDAQPLLTEVETLTRQARVQSVVVRQLASAGPHDVLTKREREVLILVAKGHSNKRIGEQLYITTRTAGLHVSRILHKLGVSNRNEAAAVARRHGLVGDD
jgi:DNA-binding CsgD family transcriptional regulator